MEQEIVGISLKSAARPQAARRPRGKWWAYAVLACVALAAWPLYRYNLYHLQLSAALADMESNEFSSAIERLEGLKKSFPRDARVTYWLAVSHRRVGHVREYDGFLRQAGELGYPQPELERQQLLLRLQAGAISEELEQQAESLLEEAPRRKDQIGLFVDEFYEARIRGYLANYQLLDAGVAIDHWMAARPQSVPAHALRGLVCERQNDFSGAEAEYRKLLDFSPTNNEARLSYATMLVRNQKVEQAAREYAACLSQDPENPRAQMGMAECECRLAKGPGLAAAEERLKSFLERDLPPAGRAQALLLLGSVASLEGKPELVIQSLEEGLKLAPQTETAPYQQLATAYAALNQREKANEYLKQGRERQARNSDLQKLLSRVEFAPQNAEARFQVGNYYLQEKRPDEAAAWWAMAARLDPLHQRAHEALADYQANYGKDEQLLAFHRRMIERAAEATFEALWRELLDSNVAAVREGLPHLTPYPSLKAQAELLTLGLNVIEHKDLERTTEELGRLTNNPRLRLRALTLLGEALYFMGHLRTAERAFDEVLAANPRNIVAHRWLQSINFDIGAYDRMEYHALKVAEFDKTDHRPHRHLGFLRREAENYAGAIKDYQESLRRSPHQQTREEVLLEMADCYVQITKYEEAQKVLKDAKPSAQRSYLEARSAYATKDLAQAKKVLDGSLKTWPDHAPSLLLRSDIAVNDDAAVARELLERAIKAAPYDSNAHLKLSTVLLRLGDKDAAKKEGDRAKELLDLEVRFSELNNQASQRPGDIGIRRELAALAKQLGRDEEAQRWRRAADGMEEESAPASKAPALSAKRLDSERLILSPDLKSVGPPVSPSPAAPGREPAPAGDGPKACGDEQEREKRPAAREEKPPEKKEDKPEAVFSGPQKGEKLPGLTIKVAGEEEKELDLVKEAGGKPTLLIFVHQVTRPSVGLTRVLGDYAATRKKDGLQAGAIFLTADATETKAWIKRASGALPKSVPLGIADGGQEGPGAYGLNRNVTMTILVAKEGKVTANFALVQPSLQADGPKILKEIVEVLGGGKVPSIEELMPMPGAPRRGQRGKEPERPNRKDGEREKKRDGEKKSP